MQVVIRRHAHVAGQSDEFTEALYQLSHERGGGYIPRKDVEDRAATLQVVERIKLPPLLPPLVKKLPPL